MVLKCNNQLQAIGKYFPVVMFTMLYKAGQLLSLCTKSLGVTIKTNATELPGPEVLFIILYKAVLTFESVDETLVLAF